MAVASTPVTPSQPVKSRKVLSIPLASALLLVLTGVSNGGPNTTSENAEPSLMAAVPADMCSWPMEPESAYPESMGGDLAPIRYVVDPYPTFNGLALDNKNERVVMSDENRKSVLMYDRTVRGKSTAVAPPVRQIMGPKTEIGYISGIELDPERRELYAVNNDIEDRIVVFDYDAHGDVKPKRRLYVPHQTWGASLNPIQSELAISVQQLSMIAVYRREAKGLEAPLRVIEGSNTGMADPHGIRWDVSHHEIAVANHGNNAIITPYSAYDATAAHSGLPVGGHFLSPSITVFADSAEGDSKPLRKIQGPRTKLNWPMGIDIDPIHNEIAVANNGANSVLIFPRTRQGNVAPVREIRGAGTGLSSPMGVAIDTKNNQLWVANYGDHTALVFARTATGNASPQRIIRNAPAGTPTGGFGNPYAVAYDSKRDQLLVPN